MPDRENVIKAVDICLGHGKCNDCPYCLSGKGYTTMNCRDYMLRDALTLLKEQEAVKPKSKVRHGANAQIQHFCGRCNAMLHGKPKFCSGCGQEVKWK